MNIIPVTDVSLLPEGAKAGIIGMELIDDQIVVNVVLLATHESLQRVMGNKHSSIEELAGHELIGHISNEILPNIDIMKSINKAHNGKFSQTMGKVFKFIMDSLNIGKTGVETQQAKDTGAKVHAESRGW